jgi:hypothetical protein
VTFLQAFTDGFTTPYPDINTFTGQCMTGGSAATQGNEFLIPTPPLPPCAPAICGVQPLPAPHAISLGPDLNEASHCNPLPSPPRKRGSRGDRTVAHPGFPLSREWS